MVTKTIGLRIDVDTYRGTLRGVPNLLSILDKFNIKASFFFSVGPDNMGRHLFRLLKPAFFIKMLKSNAASLYGWDILFKGTLWPGPTIGIKLKKIIAASSEKGHEIGLHAWDHHYWQSKIDKMTQQEMECEIKKGYDLLKSIVGDNLVCSAAPGWKADNTTILLKEKFNFLYNSDCRGSHVFFPEVAGRKLTIPQIPVSLPTYDEVIGRDSIDNDNYNDYLMSLLKPDELNVLTIHAEAEGIVLSNLFEDFIKKVIKDKYALVPLGELLKKTSRSQLGKLERGMVRGREGWIAVGKRLVN